MINQTRYIDDVVIQFNQQDAKAVVNPCETGMKLSKTQSPTTDAECENMRGGERIPVAVLVEPWAAALEGRHPRAPLPEGIVYSGNNGKVGLEAYTDADWGSNLDDR
ncbi:hypothetical protein PR002_g17100 [Phytophthora rubi]|uniref:Reverse transcriptase Ty1/copia-type domain-containing protein n=1 Tax=Phytophthora rubi TaxID=129364 RepID=A0A6A3KFF6_9STRA|nr:hypothetical protein PR002_g17100 [Phytophthora rubi]